MAKRTILVLYYSRGVYPLRDTIKKHLYAWRNYSRHDTIYINVALGFPDKFFETHAFDAIIYHTSLCGIRWGDGPFVRFKNLLEPVSKSSAYKIAIPQDEFVHTSRLVEFLNFVGVDLILSCAYESEWPKIYEGLETKAKIKTVLTGYLDTKSIKRIAKFAKPLEKRKNHVVYRAWRAAYWLGAHGQLKVEIGERAKAACERLGLQSDISLNDADTIAGEAWFEFLADSRSTVGVEGGASIIDKHGSIKKAVEDYLSSNPDASFEETRAEVFSDAEGGLDLRAISPRHLEAIAVRCCQVLVRGEYNGILEADRHYIPVEEDFSDLDEALLKLNDTAYVQNILDTAFDEVIRSEKYSYSSFVSEIDALISESPQADDNKRPSLYWKLLFGIRDWFAWQAIKHECKYVADKGDRVARNVAGAIIKTGYPLPRF